MAPNPRALAVALDPLTGMIADASREAEAAFAKTGQLSPTWRAVTAEGKLLVLPPLHPHKDSALILLRAFFQIAQVEKYVFVDEAWTLRVDNIKTPEDQERIDRAERDGLSTSTDPDRLEVVMFIAEDVNGLSMAHREIVRPSGRKPYLAPLDFLPTWRGGSWQGRMVGLLPRKQSALQ